MKGRPLKSYKYKHPITKEPIGVYEYRYLIRKLNLISIEQREKEREHNKIYYKKNKQKIMLLNKEWFNRNIERQKNYFKEYCKRPEVIKRRKEYNSLIKEKRKNERDLKQSLRFGMDIKEYHLFRSICSRCGFKEYPCDIHHIDQNPLNNIKSNLISLCPSCHLGVHRKHFKL